ncbi:MAG: hypothetical protein NTW19_17745 [Planctomycetota bacterium]|nr:hypothetical protein [Planctomycetota bacterium]
MPAISPQHDALPPDPARPYLSVVATARNDDHGGNLLGRMQIFVDSLDEQCRRLNLSAELVIVEWNPPGDRPGLRDALRWPAPGGRLATRLIQVPNQVHANFQHAQALPLFQMIAKNVGIRRALGQFVLATNIDILFSNELMELIAARNLDAARMYRIDRFDVDADMPASLPGVDQRLAWCREHVIRVNERVGTRNLRSGDFHRIYWDPSWRVVLLEALQEMGLVPVVTRKRLHLNACGDFTLMSRDRWEKLGGYPELEVFSMHLDAILCTAAHIAGVREKFLPPPMACYHVEHATGSGFKPEGQTQLNDRLARAGIPQVSNEQFHRWAVQMRRERKPMIFNNRDWGLANIELHEQTAA